MTKCIDLDSKRLRNATVLILGREKDDLQGILSVESTNTNYVFTMNPDKMKYISEVEANRIIEDLADQRRKAPVIKINKTIKENKTFDLRELSFEKVILTF